jgi:putative PIN family toxin of toxin-antitoxin system
VRIVLDTNVLVSGFLSPHGPPGAILRSILTGSIALCFDERILAEYRDVLTRGSFAFDEDRIDEILELIETNGESVLAEPLGVALPDADDAMFVEVATAADADVLVTGNRKHFPEPRMPDVRVRSPSAFVDECLRNRPQPDPA